MPQVMLESGRVLGTLDGTPAHGSEIVVQDGDSPRTFVVVRQRWVVHMQDMVGKCEAVIVRPLNATPDGASAGETSDANGQGPGAIGQR